MSKLVIFDLDGTLFDTFEDIYDSLTHVLKKYSYPIPSIDEAKSFVGDGLKTFIASATGFVKSPELLPHNVMEEYLKRYSDNLVAKTKPFDGIVECVEKLYNDGNILAVLSNKSEFLVKNILDHFGLTNYFEYIAGGDTFTEKKPSPIPIINIMNLLSIYDTENVVVIGDSVSDVLSAKNANAKVIYCNYGYGKTISHEPDYTVNSATEIYDIVNNIFSNR